MSSDNTILSAIEKIVEKEVSAKLKQESTNMEKRIRESVRGEIVGDVRNQIASAFDQAKNTLLASLVPATMIAPPSKKTVIKTAPPARKKSSQKNSTSKPKSRVKRDKHNLFFNYEQVQDYGVYQDLLKSGLRDITTERQKAMGTLCFFDPKKPNIFYTLLSNGTVRQNIMKKGIVVEGESNYAKGNVVHPGPTEHFERIGNTANRFRAMASHVIKIRQENA